MTRLETVLQYARQGWSVIPVEAKGKKPLIDSWKPNQDERASEEQIIAWWTRWPDANIGIVTGSISGIIVLDVDGEEGQKTIKTSGLHLPPTVTARTGGGGYHYLYKHPGFACKNSAGSIGQNIDFRGDGGYIVAPGSLHKSGNVYEWVLSPEDAELADAPEWLLQAIKGQGKPQGVQCPDWGDTVPQGQRNDTLTKLAGSLLAKMGADDALPMLLAWNQTKCEPPLPEAEVQRTVESVWNLENQNQAWPEPEKLEVDLLPVAKLPPAIIPEPFRPWLEDVAYRMQCPLDFVAIGTMVVAGSVIGAGCGIRPKKYDDWLVIPNLWGGIIARPSMMKTPALSEIIAPLKRLEAQAKRDYELELAEAEVEQVVIKAAKDSIVGEMKRAASGKSKKNMEQLKEELADLEDPPVPARRRFVTNDPTIEKMAELLNESPRGLLYFRDELVGLLLNLEREDRQADRAFYLEAWNGYGSYTTDRIGRGTIDTENMCVSILGGIQPSKLLGYLYQAKSDLQNDGLLQRFQLMVYPDEPNDWRYVDKPPDNAAKHRGAEILEVLADMDFLEHGAQESDGKVFLRFNAEAQDFFRQWLEELQDKLQTEQAPLMVEHLSKYRSLLPSLALIIHLVDVADGTAQGPVRLLAAQKAAAWCEYLESHARRIYGMGGRAELKAAQALAEKIEAGEVVDGFTPRDVYRNQWTSLTTKELVKEATDELMAAGWLRTEKIRTGGRPSVVFRINPKKCIPRTDKLT